MTHAHQHDTTNRAPGRRRTIVLAPLTATATALMLAACGTSHTDKLTPSQQAQAEAPLIAYATCMRSHGARDFPNPSISPASHGTAQVVKPSMTSPAPILDAASEVGLMT